MGAVARDLYGNLAALFAAAQDVFVSGNQNWFPREGEPQLFKAPDVYVKSPLSSKDSSSIAMLLPTLLDKTTTSTSTEFFGRINVNTAPAAVLATLPGLQDTDVQTILSLRPAAGSAELADPTYQTPAWLMTQANLPASTLKTLERYITARSQVFRLQSVGHFDGGGPTARIEAVIDTNGGRPRIVYWRDLTEAGKGFQLQN